MFVYVIRADASGLTKVGISADPETRLRSLEAEAGTTLGLVHVERAVDARKAEREAHLRLRPWHVEGEWFSCAADEGVRAVRAAIAGSEIERPTNYPAIMERTATGFSVYFPDLPGCTSAGSNLEDTWRSAVEALEAHCLGLFHDMEWIPDATPPDGLQAEDLARGVLAYIPIVWPGQLLRLNITLDQALLSEIDKVARNRSAFLASAARLRLRTDVYESLRKSTKIPSCIRGPGKS